MSESSPVATHLVQQFLTDRCELSADYRVPRSELLAAWREWCERHQRPAAPANTFGRRLRAAVPGLGAARVRINGTTVGHYTGLRLRAVPAASPTYPTTGATLHLLEALRVASGRLRDAAVRLVEQADTGSGGLMAVTSVVTAAYDYVETALGSVAEWGVAQINCLGAACQQVCDTAARERDRAVSGAERAVAQTERVLIDLRAAESIAAQVLGAGFCRQAGVVTLDGVTDGLADTVPDA